MSDVVLRCPVCHRGLVLDGQVAGCDEGHRFDRAREGHLHLLTPGKAHKKNPGDDAAMVSARRRFLDLGHYRCLSQGLREWVGELQPSTVLDVGCGEGSFTQAMLAELPSRSEPDPRYVSFDISRPAMRLAARRCTTAITAIASVNDMPAMDHSVELVASVMSPVLHDEFTRVLAPTGRALIVTPGDSHLAELRAELYEHYRPHDEHVPLADTWTVVEQRRFTAHVHLGSTQEILDVWGMTPYRWNAPVEGAQRVGALQELDVTVHFVGTLLSPPR